MKFDMNSLTKKYERFTGKNWNDYGNNDINYLKNHANMVSLEYNSELLDSMHIVRDWCQEHFGDDWIYNWNDFYFIRKEDAAYFALKWL